MSLCAVTPPGANGLSFSSSTYTMFFNISVVNKELFSVIVTILSNIKYDIFEVTKIRFCSHVKAERTKFPFSYLT